MNTKKGLKRLAKLSYHWRHRLANNYIHLFKSHFDENVLDNNCAYVGICPYIQLFDDVFRHKNSNKTQH